MSRLKFNIPWDAMLVATAALMAVGFSQLTQRAMAADDADGKVVEISPHGLGDQKTINDKTLLADEGQGTDEAKAPDYWLGIAGGPIGSPLLRSQLQLAGDVGVAVVQVVPESPAEKAGIKPDDILIAVNGDALHDLASLKQVVTDSKGKPVELKLLRLAKEMKVTVTPEKPPADLVAKTQPQVGAFPGLPGAGTMDDFLRQFGGAQFRAFAPGMIGQGMQMNMATIPGGVSVAIAREGDGPAKITVKRGDESWEIVGDDKEALAKLPEDVRPFVEQMLSGQQQNGGPRGTDPFQFHGPAMALPGPLGNMDNGDAVKEFQKANADLQKRMDEMQKQLEDLNRRLKTDAGEDDTST